MDIDLVYLWVNGNDPKWIAKRNACIGKLLINRRTVLDAMLTAAS